MQQVSDIYKELLNDDYEVESLIQINSILPVSTHTDKEIKDDTTGLLSEQDAIFNLQVFGSLFPDQKPSVGNCMSRRVEFEVLMPPQEIPRRARVVPYSRLFYEDKVSEWIPKGVYYIDTRTKSKSIGDEDALKITGYDSMLKTEQLCKGKLSELTSFPVKDKALVNAIASAIEVNVHPDTLSLLNDEFSISSRSKLNQYTFREILSYIGIWYGGNWIVDDLGRLKLLQLKHTTDEVADVGLSANELTLSEQFDTYGSVTIVVDEDHSYTAGTTSTGRHMEVECPLGSQAMATKLLANLAEYHYTPYTAQGSITHPAIELGDSVTVGQATARAAGVQSTIFSQDLNFSGSLRADIAAPVEEEIDHEFEFAVKRDRKVDRQIVTANSNIATNASGIAQNSAKIVTIQGDIVNIKATIVKIEGSVEVLGKLSVRGGYIYSSGGYSTSGIALNNGLITCKHIDLTDGYLTLGATAQYKGEDVTINGVSYRIIAHKY